MSTAPITLPGAAWDRLAEALRVLAALDDRTMLWHERWELADLPPGPGLQEAAIELAERDAAEARLELLAQGKTTTIGVSP